MGSIILKTNSTSGSTPDPQYIQVGEPVFNSYDGVLFIKKLNGELVAINRQSNISSSYAITASYALNGGGGGASVFDINGSTIHSLDTTKTNFSPINSFLVGEDAGTNSSGSEHLIAIGKNAGKDSQQSPRTTAIGINAGQSSSYSNDSVIIGPAAGEFSNSLYRSVSIGHSASYGASNKGWSVHLGEQAGLYASNSTDSIFVGDFAGAYSNGADTSIFMGYEAGSYIRDGYFTIALGSTSAYSASNSYYSQFIGPFAGRFVENSDYMISIGAFSSQYSKNSSQAVFLGEGAAEYADGISAAVGVGPYVLGGASASYQLVSIGRRSGEGIWFSDNTVTVGAFAGRNGRYSNNAVYIGYEAGIYAPHSSASFFAGFGSGYYAASSSFSNFIGTYAGGLATSSFSTFIGARAGFRQKGRNNIIIGTDIGLPENRNDSVNIGGIIFATGSYFNPHFKMTYTGYDPFSTAGEPFTGSMNGRVGINVVDPTEALHVAGNVKADNFIGTASYALNGGSGSGGTVQILPGNSIGVAVWRSGSQTINGSQAVSFTTEYRDDLNFWSLSNPTRITIPAGADGWYAVAGNVYWNPMTGLGRRGIITLNGVEIAGDSTSAEPDHNDPRLSATAIRYLVEGDYLEWIMSENFGGTVDIYPSASLSAVRISSPSSSLAGFAISSSYALKVGNGENYSITSDYSIFDVDRSPLGRTASSWDREFYIPISQSFDIIRSSSLNSALYYPNTGSAIFGAAINSNAQWVNRLPSQSLDSWTAVFKISANFDNNPDGIPAGNAAIGIVISSGSSNATTLSNNSDAFMVGYINSDFRVETWRMTGGFNYSSTVSSDSVMGGRKWFTDWMYFRVRKEGSFIMYDLGYNGETYETFMSQSVTSHTGTPTMLGIARVGNATKSEFMNVAWMRFSSGSNAKVNGEFVQIPSALAILSGSIQSASYAQTASYAQVFPYTGNALISGSLLVTGSGGITIQNPTSPTLRVQGSGGTGSISVASDFRVGSDSNVGVSLTQNGAVAWYIDTNKHFIPNVNNSYDIGTNSVRVRNLFVTAITSSNPIASASYASFVSGGANTFIPLWNSANALTGSVMLQNAGNIALGRTSPLYRFDVSGSIRGTRMLIDGQAGSNRLLTFTTNDTSRWNIYANSSTEAGSNAGSNFVISRYTDAGAYIDDPFTINRATGLTTIASMSTGLLTSTGTLTVSRSLSVQTIIERGVVTASAPSATLNYDIVDESILFHSASTSANWTLNFRGNATTTLNSMLNTGDSVTVALMVLNGSTAYSASVYQIDGSPITPRWQNGTIPVGNANSIDAHTYTIMKTGNAQYILLASLTQFA